MPLPPDTFDPLATAMDTAERPAAPPPDSLASAMDAHDSGQQVRLRANLSSAVGTSPDQFAAAKRTADYLGYPIAAVQSLPHLEQQAQVQQIAEGTASHPALQQAYTEADFARLAHDDHAGLAGVGNALEFLGRSTYSGLLSLEGAGVKIVDALNPFTLSESDAAVLWKNDPEGFQRWKDGAAGSLTRWSQGLQGASEMVMDDLSGGAKEQYAGLKYGTLKEGESAWRSPIKIVGDALQSLPTSAALALTAVLTRGASIRATAAAEAAGMDAAAARAVGVVAAEHTAARVGAISEGAVGAAQQNLQTRSEADKVGDADVQSSETYQRLLKEGFSSTMARTLMSANAAEQSGQIAGIVDAATNFVGGKFLGRIIGEGGNRAVAGARGFANEGLTEAVQSAGEQFGQNWAEQQQLNPNQGLGDNVLESALQGLAVGGLTGGAVTAATARGARAQREIETAQANSEKLTALMDAAGQSKLRERSPETFAQLVQNMAQASPSAPESVFIDGRTLTEELQKAGISEEAFNQLVPDVREQLAEARATGGAVELPIGQVAAKIAGTSLEKILLPHMRTEADGLSPAEAEESSKQADDLVKQSVERGAKEAADREERTSSGERVGAAVLEQLTKANRNTEDVNEAYARLVQAFYESTSGRLGISPEELHQQFPLQVSGAPLVDASVADRFGQDDAAPSAGKRRRKGGKAADTARAAESSTATSEPEAAAPAAPAAPAQPSRGTYAPTNLGIVLNPQANLSTFLHESGHFYLDVLGRLAVEENAPPALAQDFDNVLTWFGVKADKEADRTAAQVWAGMSLEQQRPYHERWAESFEQYLIEGKAPSLALRRPFQRFRSWMLQVYQSLRDFATGRGLGVSEEIRGVMDRLLATEQDIAEAEEQARFEAVYKTAEEAGMDPHEWAVYQDMHREGTDAAIDEMGARRIADMKWAAAAHAKELRKAQRAVDAKAKAVLEEVTAEVRASPLEQARARISEIRTSTPEQKAAFALWRAQRAIVVDEAVDAGKAALVAANPDVKGLKKGQLLARGKRDIAHQAEGAALEWEKANPRPVPELPALQMDALAEEFGFTSGDELSQQLKAQPSAKATIESLSEQRLLERYGDLISPAAIEAAATQAVHNEARARFLATELATMQRALSVKEKLPGAKVSTNALVATAKQFAEAIIGRRKIRELSPAKYTAAERRAGREAAQATAAGKIAEAVAAQRDRLLNLYAAKRALQAQQEVQSGVEYLTRMGADSTRKGLDADYTDQIDALLEKFDLRQSTSLTEVDRRKSLATWIASQEALGIEPNIPQDLIDKSTLTSYKDMTVDDFRALVDTVKQIEHLGRLKKKLLTAADKREFAETVAAITASITANADGRQADARTPTHNTGRWLQGLRNFGSAHIKAATLARIFDGGKDGGAVWDYLIRPANAAGDQETRMRAQAAEALNGILEPWLRGGPTGGKGRFFEGVATAQDRRAGRTGSSFNREAIFAIALNTGNASNLQRLLSGEGWTQAHLKPLLDTLSAGDWRVVQGVWDHFESYRPLIGAKEKRVFGKEPEWIAPLARTINLPGGETVELKGGYYPVKFDPLATAQSEQHSDAEAAKQLMQGAHNAATTRRSFTKTRVEEVNGRPLLYTMSGLYAGVNDVIHDLSWHEWLIDANRLLRSLDPTIREHYGPAVVKQFKSWRDAVAAGDDASNAALDSALGWARHGIGAAGLTFNVMSALMQPVGLTQSIVRVGARWVGKGLQTYVANPVAATKDAQARSAFMESRARTRFRELNEIRNRVQGQSAARRHLTDTGYFLMMQCQQMVDVPTWHGAYEKAVADGALEDRAVALADQAVIDAQGGGQTKDLSAIERGGPAQKLFTVFYSFMNTALNLGYGQAKTAPKTAAGRAKLAADMLMLFVIPPVLGAVMKDALTPGDSGDYDDWQKLFRKLAGEQLTFLLGLMVVSREFGEAGKSLLGLSDHPRDYAGPAGVRMIADTGTAAKQIQQGEFDDSFRKAVINLAGDAMALPAAQINRTVTGFEALKEGKTSNPAALVLGYQERR